MWLTNYRIFASKVRVIAVCLCAAMTIQSCENGLRDGRPSEGILTFEVTYPYLANRGIMAAMMPNTMNLKFKNDVYASDLVAWMGLFRMGFISGNERKELKNFLKVGKERLVVQLSEEETKRYLLDFPELTIIFTAGVDTIAGFACKEAIAIYNDASKPDMTLYYTDEIKMTSPNWCNQFHEIEGVLLAYEVDRYDIRMRFRATGFEAEGVEDADFSVPPDFNMVSVSALEGKIEETLGTFNF